MAEKNLSRRSFLKKSVYAGTAVGGAALLGTGAWSVFRERPIDELYGEYPPASKLQPLEIANPRAEKPNVIVIYCDDLGYGDVGCYGSSSIKTPHVDRLARGGSRFTDYYTCAAVCAPSRAGLLTGRYPFRTGVIGNPYPKNDALSKKLARRFGQLTKNLGILDQREDYVARGLDSREITMAEALKTAGYRTGMIGKWHLGDYSQQPEFNPRKHGFDEYFGVPHSNDMRPFPLYRNEEEVEADMGDNQAQLTGLYTKEAQRFIDESGDKPFFLYFAHTFPHQPLHASDKFAKKSEGGKFGDAVEEIDWSVGELVKLLEKKNLRKKTMIIFTSDNGPWYEGSAGSLRGRKGQSYDGGFRVPFIVNWPGRIPAGKTVTGAAMNIDIFPTLLNLAGVQLPADRIIDGKDIFSLMRGRTQESPHEELYFYHYDLLAGIRMKNWKYYRQINRYVWPIPLDAAPVPNSIGKSQLGNRWPLLYNMQKDPGESYNAINTYPKVAESLRKRMEKWEQGVQKNPRGFKNTAGI